MSIIVAIKDGDRVLVGCDSQVTEWGTKKSLKKNIKIWKPDDDKEIVMGVAGDLRDSNIMATTTNWIDELTKNKNNVNFKYVVRTIVPKIFKELEDNGRLFIKEGIKSMCCEVIFAYKDKAFLIEGDGTVFEMDDMICSGSGHSVCEGAWNIVKGMDLCKQEAITQIINTVCENDLYCSKPIIIMNTKNDTICTFK